MKPSMMVARLARVEQMVSLMGSIELLKVAGSVFLSPFLVSFCFRNLATIKGTRLIQFLYLCRLQMNVQDHFHCITILK